MIRATIRPYSPAYDLRDLLTACDQANAVEWAWNPETTLVAFHKDEIVGMIAAWVGDQPYVFVDSLMVHPDYRAQGVGASLCFSIAKLLHERGVKIIRAITESPIVTRSLLKYGFEIVGKHYILERFEE